MGGREDVESRNTACQRDKECKLEQNRGKESYIGATSVTWLPRNGGTSLTVGFSCSTTQIISDKNKEVNGKDGHEIVAIVTLFKIAKIISKLFVPYDNSRFYKI